MVLDGLRQELGDFVATPGGHERLLVWGMPICHVTWGVTPTALYCAAPVGVVDTPDVTDSIDAPSAQEGLLGSDFADIPHAWWRGIIIAHLPL